MITHLVASKATANPPDTCCAKSTIWLQACEDRLLWASSQLFLRLLGVAALNARRYSFSTVRIPRDEDPRCGLGNALRLLTKQARTLSLARMTYLIQGRLDACPFKSNKLEPLGVHLHLWLGATRVLAKSARDLDWTELHRRLQSNALESKGEDGSERWNNDTPLHGSTVLKGGLLCPSLVACQLAFTAVEWLPLTRSIGVHRL